MLGEYSLVLLLVWTRFDGDSMWHELRAVLHNRENTLVTVLVQNFAREEQEFAESVLGNWVSLGEGVEGMPFE